MRQKTAEALRASEEADKSEAEELIKARGALKSSKIVSTAGKAQVAVQNALEIVHSPGKKPAQQMEAEAQYNEARTKAGQEKVAEAESEIEFQRTYKQISGQAAIAKYTQLLQLHNLTRAERQQILEKVKTLQNEIGVGNNQVYDLAPGKIKLPTAYDVNRAISEATVGGRSIAATDQSTNTTNVIVNVQNSHDVHKVINALDEHVPGVKSRLKAKGVTGHTRRGQR